MMAFKQPTIVLHEDGVAAPCAAPGGGSSPRWVPTSQFPADNDDDDISDDTSCSFPRRSGSSEQIGTAPPAPPAVRGTAKGFLLCWVAVGALCLGVIRGGYGAHPWRVRRLIDASNAAWLLSCGAAFVAASAYPSFYTRHRSALLLQWWMGAHMWLMHLLTLYPVGLLQRHLVAESVFNGFVMQVLELPLRYNLLHMAANAAMLARHDWLLTQPVGGWATLCFVLWLPRLLAGTLFNCVLAAALSKDVDAGAAPLLPPRQALMGRSGRWGRAKHGLQLADWALRRLEWRVFTTLAGIDHDVLKQLLCYPVVFVASGKAAMAFISKDSATLQPIEVLLSMLCCVLLGACEQQALGATLAARLKVARFLLADLVPAHIATNMEEDEVARSALLSKTSSLDKRRSSAGKALPPPRSGMRRMSLSLLPGQAAECLAAMADRSMVAGHNLMRRTTSGTNLLATSVSLGSDEAAPRRQYAEVHDCVTVLFGDVVGFTAISCSSTPDRVMAMLNELYSRFDSAITELGLYKVETIGDCYMAAAGLLRKHPNHAERMVEFALRMQQEAAQVMTPAGVPLRMRIGINSGRVMSGVVGKIRCRFCLFGDTVNTASRMETSARNGRIHVSEDTYRHVANCCPQFSWQCLGESDVKGKGRMVTYELRETMNSAAPADGAATACTTPFQQS